MAVKRVGAQTVRFENPPSVLSYASVVGKKEGEGPLAKNFDFAYDDNTLGEKTWEKSEIRLQKEALTRAIAKSGLPVSEIDYIFGGDLINQCIASSFGLREFEIPFFGLYGACSTLAEGLSLAAMSIDGGYSDTAAAITSSHFSTAERQYRTPIEYGSQRTPPAQWTVTGSGVVILNADGCGPYLTHQTTGIICDMGITDAANMGAAMAPAAHSTISALFRDTKTTPADYDLIVTGDLGAVGHELLLELFKRDGINFPNNLTDCGIMIFDAGKQDTHAGGSGCGCSAVTLCGKLLGDMQRGKLERFIFAGTGALLSPVTIFQGESIPGICHTVVFSKKR